jgi:phage-related minor tail protein
MQLSSEQIKALIAMQIEGCGRRLGELSREIALLRKQPIRGSRELMQRLHYLEGEQVKQQARLDTLKDLQQHIETLEGFARES